MSMSKLIYMLGHDPNSRFILSQLANSLESHSKNLKLLFKDSNSLQHFIFSGSQISYENCLNKKNSIITRHGFGASIVPQRKDTSMSEFSQEKPHIDSLIITNRSLQNENILNTYKYYMSSETNLVFINPILGSIDNIIKHLWGSAPETCPNIFQGVSTHVLENGPSFDVKHIQTGTLKLSVYPKDGNMVDFIKSQQTYFPNDVETPEVVKHLLNTEMLNPLYLPYKDVYISQLENLIVDACMVPISILIGLNAGSIPSIERTISKIVSECIYILNGDEKIESLKTIDPTFDAVLNKQRLIELALNATRYTSNQSLENREIRTSSFKDLVYANGHIIELAKQQNKYAVVNTTMFDMVLAKQELAIQESHIPLFG